MDINKITYFFTAAELHNFTRAADKCGIAQTTMSKYISSLENELGHTLFYRTNKGCALTAEGEKFYSGMQSIHQDYLDLCMQVEMLGERTLWIGVEDEHHTIVEFLEFEEEHPEIGISVFFDDREVLFKDMALGKYDALLFTTILPEESVECGDLKRIELKRQKEYMICSRIVLKRYGSPANVIKHLPLITKTDDIEYHKYCSDVLLKKYGETFSDTYINRSISKQQFMVRLGQGFAIVPKFELSDSHDFEIFPMGEAFYKSMQLLYDDNKISDDMKKFLEYIRANYSE